MSRVMIRSGRVLDPASNRDEIADVLVEDGRIVAIAPSMTAKADHVVDARGMAVAPGLVDIHVHLREPGREDEEKISSGTRAAAAGGFTTICCMPNTDPIIDSSTSVNYIRAIAAQEGVVRVHPIAAATRGSKGTEVTEWGDLQHHGAVAFSDDGKPIHNANIMRRLLEYTAMLGVPVLNHAEVPELVGDGVAHEGRVAARLGLRGVPSAAEAACVARDIEIAAQTGGHLHVLHVSTARACELIADAKRRGIRVTGEVTPHHLILTEDAIGEFDTMARVSPPLRSAEDRAALREAIRSGVLDCIATDHAPHTDIEKELPFDQAPPGMIGLDFAFALLFTELVDTGFMDLMTLLRRMTCAPADIVRLEAGRLAAGAPADIVVIDLQGETRIAPETIHSKSRNTPFMGRTLRGRIAHTLVGGQLVHSDGRILADALAVR